MGGLIRPAGLASRESGVSECFDRGHELEPAVERMGDIGAGGDLSADRLVAFDVDDEL